MILFLIIVISFSSLSLSLSSCNYEECSEELCVGASVFWESKKESDSTADSTWPMSLADTMGAQLIFFYHWSTKRVYKIMEWDLHKQIEDGREKIEKISGVCLFLHDLRIIFIIIVIIVFITWLFSHNRLGATGGWSCSCSRVNTLCAIYIFWNSGIHYKKNNNNNKQIAV